MCDVIWKPEQSNLIFLSAVVSFTFAISINKIEELMIYFKKQQHWSLFSDKDEESL